MTDSLTRAREPLLPVESATTIAVEVIKAYQKLERDGYTHYHKMTMGRMVQAGVEAALAPLLDTAVREARVQEHKLDCPLCIPQLRCIAYPDCDGDLPGEPHSEKCLARGEISLPCARLRSLKEGQEL